MFWDYNVDYSSAEIYDFIIGKREIAQLNRNQVIARMLVTLRWYDMIDIFGVKRMYGFLTDDVLEFIWKKSIKTRYKNVRETLHTIL